MLYNILRERWSDDYLEWDFSVLQMSEGGFEWVLLRQYPTPPPHPAAQFKKRAKRERDYGTTTPVAQICAVASTY